MLFQINKIRRNLIFLSGLPRTGSTLLTSILIQNPNIHIDSDGQSAVCQLMWDMQTSCQGKSSEQLLGSGKLGIVKSLMSSIPKIYYSEINKPIIIDKCREWAHPANVDMITNYITPNPKIIVTTRNFIDVVKSYVYIRKMNNHPNPETGILDEGSEPIMRAFRAVEWAKKNNDGKFLFVDYDELLIKPKLVLEEIYSFINLKPFEHKFTNIINPHPNRDEIYGLIGLHDIRPKIEKRDLDIELSAELKAKAMEIANSEFKFKTKTVKNK
jgi:sulfotransferase